MDLLLQDRVVLVTGGSTGIGRAIAHAFGRERARVAITYRSKRQEVEQVAQEVIALGGKAMVVAFDLMDDASIVQAVAVVQRQWSTIDVLVNNAVLREAAGTPGNWPLFEEVTSDTWRPFLAGSLGGVYKTLQTVVPLMRAQQWGRIVTVSSTQAEDGFPGASYYAAAKAGLHGVNASLAQELGPLHILSNIVMPGFVLTEKAHQWLPEAMMERMREQTPTRRLATPEDVANLVVFLSSPVNQHINGEAIRVSGGK